MTAEPSTLTHLDNPARHFSVSSENGFVTEIEVTYRGGGWWRAQLNTGAPRTEEHCTSRSLRTAQKWAATTMEEHADTARATCERETCKTDGMDDPQGSGNFACGVLSPHGISVQVTDGDGNDLTQDYLNNGM